MEKFIPCEKLSKKEKRKNDQAKRQTWGERTPSPGSRKTARPTTERNHRHGSGNCRLILIFD